MTTRLGRPPLFDAEASDRIAVNVTPTQYRELQHVARAHGQTVSALIREAVNVFVADYGEPHLFPPRRR